MNRPILKNLVFAYLMVVGLFFLLLNLLTMVNPAVVKSYRNWMALLLPLLLIAGSCAGLTGRRWGIGLALFICLVYFVNPLVVNGLGLVRGGPVLPWPSVLAATLMFAPPAAWLDRQVRQNNVP